MTVKMYLFTLVSQGVSMPGMGGQYAPEYPGVERRGEAWRGVEKKRVLLFMIFVEG